MNIQAHLDELTLADAVAFRALAGRLRALPEREPSADLTERILAAVDAERKRKPPRFRVPSPWWGLAAAAAALAVAAFLFDSGVPSQGTGVATASDSASGLTWLAANQEPDGTWSPSKHGGAEIYRPALTALSVLALDRDGKSEAAAQVDRACAALVAMQGADGTFGGSGRACLYNHAITAFALATLYPKHPTLRPTLERALAFVAARQTAQGGWDYEPGSEGNAAITAWLVRALACASAQGFDAAKTPLRKGLRWLRDSARDDDSIVYHRDSTARSDGLTALAAYALITAGKEFPGLPELGRRVAGSLRVASETSRAADCYRDYAKVLAFESVGASTQAETVRQQMQASQKAAQPDQWGSVGGKLYTAAFAALAAR